MVDHQRFCSVQAEEKTIFRRCLDSSLAVYCGLKIVALQGSCWILMLVVYIIFGHYLLTLMTLILVNINIEVNHCFEFIQCGQHFLLFWTTVPVIGRHL